MTDHKTFVAEGRRLLLIATTPTYVAMEAVYSNFSKALDRIEALVTENVALIKVRDEARAELLKIKAAAEAWKKSAYSLRGSVPGESARWTTENVASEILAGSGAEGEK